MNKDEQADAFTNAMLSIKRALADELTSDPALLLECLRLEAQLEPDNQDYLRAIDLIAAEMADSPAVILIERAKFAGRGTHPECQVYIEEPDGRLRPATGEDLRRAEDRFPGFIKNWRIAEDEG